eukprot:10549241-Alexandrium_andersonii.AAC.1
MPRARLVQEPVGRPPDDAVQQLRFLQVRRASAEPPLNLAHELVVHERLRDVKVRVVPREGEVVAMRDAPHVQLGV